MLSIARYVFIGLLLCAGLLSQACKEESSRQGTTAWMDVTVDGDADVSLWRFDGDPLSYYETNDASPTSGTQYFGIYTSEPVTIRLELNQSGPVTLDIIAWHYESGGIMGSKLEEVDQHASFTIDEPAGTHAELTVARESDFHDLSLQIDRDADGTIDAERSPTVTTEE